VVADGRGEALALVDHVALRRFLASAVPPFVDLRLDLLAGGASNLTYFLRLDDREYVLRRRPMGATAPRAHDMQREFTVLHALRDSGLPVPRVHTYYPGDDVLGAPFYLMDYVTGDVLHQAEDAAGLNADQGRACSTRVVEVLVQLHALDAGALGISMGRPDGFLARRIDRWLRQWAQSEHRAFPKVAEVGSLLGKQLPRAQEATLIHGDYRLGNLLVDVNGKVRVKAVLDWEMSTIGDPLTDLAHLLVYWEPTRGRLTHSSQLIARVPGFMTGSELSGLYSELSGRTVDDLSFYLAFEHWRAAIIKEAIYMRGVSGDNADSERTAEMGRTVPLHLDEAAEILGS
jgi:aminoglycoside phosphotransferase (APT) family kinase protein